MKAHINSAAGGPLALLYGLPETDGAGRAVRAALKGQGIACRDIAAAQLSQPVGALAGLGGKAAAPYAGAPPDTQLLLMSGFSHAQVNALLDSLRDAGAHVPLKAVVTKHNKGWSVMALLEELAREHAAVQRYETAPQPAHNREGED